MQTRQSRSCTCTDHACKYHGRSSLASDRQGGLHNLCHPNLRCRCICQVRRSFRGHCSSSEQSSPRQETRHSKGMFLQCSCLGGCTRWGKSPGSLRRRSLTNTGTFPPSSRFHDYCNFQGMVLQAAAAMSLWPESRLHLLLLPAVEPAAKTLPMSASQA